jgi:hypothetical protein
VRGTLVHVQVSRVPAKTRPPKVLWRAYVRRFDLEHTIRFAKQTLGWTMPRVRHPEQADRWTWLVLAAYTQLHLARMIICDRQLPWERPRAPSRLSPYRVRRGFRNLGARSVHPPSRRNPAAAPLDGRPAAAPARLDATLRSRRPPEQAARVKSQA